MTRWLLTLACLMLIACGDTADDDATDAPESPQTSATATTASEPIATATDAPQATERATGDGGTVTLDPIAPVAAGDTASVTARTEPGAECTITYRTPGGSPSEAEGLLDKTADAEGVVSWEWVIGPNTGAGDGRVVVTCDGVEAAAPITIE